MSTATAQTFSFAGHKGLTEQEYLDMREYSERSWGSRWGLTVYGEVGMVDAILAGLEGEASLTLLNFGREWISWQSYQADMDRRRAGSKALLELEKERGTRLENLSELEDKFIEAWPNIHHKKARVLAGMVADAVDNGIDFNPCEKMEKIISLCADTDYWQNHHEFVTVL